ncbi:citramalyl-CoA lyase, mitochondrial-like [Cyprinus carpio]|uniref:Citramalyl-CoA lyase, mitochondrial-like n=1 Tax=Cyprinus carpio TaxID=7962 RepID=A0A9R0B2K8_CYPCA|nr:citramalyl-CoA lyase, mitochondrial-like [Cyprinus carpio]
MALRIGRASRRASVLGISRLLLSAVTWWQFSQHSHHTPGTSLKYIPRCRLRKLTSLDVDCAVLDCEDGVALNKKDAARKTIPKMLAELD